MKSVTEVKQFFCAYADTVSAARTANVWRDTTDDLQCYGRLIVITAIVCHPSAVSCHYINYLSWEATCIQSTVFHFRKLLWSNSSV